MIVSHHIIERLTVLTLLSVLTIATNAFAYTATPTEWDEDYIDYLDSLSDERNSIQEYEHDVDYIEYAADDIELASDGDIDIDNVVVYHGSFSGTAYDVFFPIDAMESLTVYNGVLYNVGSSSVSGYVVSSGSAPNFQSVDRQILTLSNPYSSSNNLYRYGALSYIRHYYSNGSSVSYGDTYGSFVVDSYERYHAEKYRLYYLGIFVILLGGVVIICRKH